jgi:hypothetical protein
MRRAASPVDAGAADEASSLIAAAEARASKSATQKQTTTNHPGNPLSPIMTPS